MSAFSADSLTRQRLTKPTALRRNGIFKRDLNTELTLAFTQRIANSWTHMVRVRLASSFKLKQRAMTPITALLDELTVSVPGYLQPCTKTLHTSATSIARSSLRSARRAILRAWEEDLKRITRILVPFVQLHLRDGYEKAARAERKKGVSVMQKVSPRETFVSRAAVARHRLVLM